MVNEFHIVLSSQAVKYLRQVLGTRPHDEVHALIEDIARQVAQQENPQVVAPNGRDAEGVTQ